VVPNQSYRCEVDVETEGVEWIRDTLVCRCLWIADEQTDQTEATHSEQDYLFVTPGEKGSFTFSGEFSAPEGSSHLALDFIHRWIPRGRTIWRFPRIQPIESPDPLPPVRVCVVTGTAESGPDRPRSVEGLVQFYAELCRKAVRDSEPGLIALPGICLQWLVKGSPLDRGVEVPGPETEVFSEIARSGKTHIAVGLLEKAGDAVYNSAVLLGPDGSAIGTYRKVHLAEGGEWLCEQAAGSEFPVFKAGIGRIGFNICMDSSVAESSRAIGLGGADFLVLPIMGDLRANSCWGERWDFDPDKWRAIMRVRAMDNKLCMVVARNRSEGSCIVDQKGDVLAWNDGDQDFVHAVVPVRDLYRFRGISQVHLNWYQRRPHLYGAESDVYNYGVFSEGRKPGPV